MSNKACRIFAEQIKLLLSLPSQEEAKTVLFQAVINSFNQFEFQNENQNGIQIDNQDYLYLNHISESESLSELSKSILNLLTKNIIWKEFSENYGGKREKAGRKQKLSAKPKQTKLSEKDILDWETLFTYWEQNKSGGKYKTPESRNRLLNRLKELTKNDLEFAKVVILDAIDHKWMGFCNGNELYYRGTYTPKPKQNKAPDSFIENEDDNHKKVWYDTATRKWHYEIPLINPDWSKWDGTNYLG